MSKRIGPFEVYDRIGRGGMGEVFRGRHISQDVDVALKIVTSERARKPQYQRAFRNEVHAMARLDHPGVIMVFDVGEIPDDIEIEGLLPGSPYVVMELATHGTLKRIREGLHWRRLRLSLYSILDALGHAHARGVIHRDLKPGNILVTSDGAIPRLKLADFGLAHAFFTNSERDLSRKVNGTPRYMAPEQIKGDWREQGPWTDLYALGCIVHWLVNGVPPFSGKLNTVLTGQVFEPPPDLEPEFEVPEQFQAWTKRLLAKHPAERFRRASDAAYELARMRLPSEVSGEFGFEEFGEGLEELTNEEWSGVFYGEAEAENALPASIDFRKGSGYSATIVDFPAMERQERGPLEERPSAYQAGVPIAESWKRRSGVGKSLQLVGAGLGLYGLRTIPMVGRKSERSTIWDALKLVHYTRTSRALVLSGAAGNGKSRLAEWMTERAHEMGVASILKATHSRTMGLSDGLSKMLGRSLRVLGLPRREGHERIRKVYFDSGLVEPAELYDCRVLAEMCIPAEQGEQDEVLYLSPTERFTVMKRYLERLSRERPLMLWMDDAQWGVDALEFANFILEEAPELPILILITVRQEAVLRDSLSERLLERIGEHKRGRLVEVHRLRPDVHVELVQELLGLEAGLAEEVAKRTDGNPLFAVQLVGDWIQRGALRITPAGFALRHDADAELPKSIQEVWRERVTQLVLTFEVPAQARIALELAAVLGDEVNEKELVHALEQLDAAIPEYLMYRMIERRLAKPSEDGWTFSHGMLRETLLAEVERGQAHVEHHQAVARGLAELYPSERLDVQERIAIHLLEARDYLEALTPLLNGAVWRSRTCDFDIATRLLNLQSAALQHLGIPESDERWGESWLVHISALLRQGIVDDAKEMVTRGNELAEEHGWSCRPEFVMRRASLARKRGDTEKAHEYYSRATELFTEPESKGRSLYGVGEAKLYRGDLEGALVQFQEAYELLEPGGEPYALVLIGSASALTRLSRFEEARPLLTEAVDRLTQLGNRNGAATALNALGELARMSGDLNAAAKSYQESRDVLIAIGSRNSVIPTMNLGLVCIAQKKWVDARSLLEEGLNSLIKSGELSHLGLLYVTLLPCVASMSDWATWDHYIAKAEAILAESEWVDPDIAHHAQLGGECALSQGEDLRALRVFSLALNQWTVLDDRDRVRELSALMEQLK